MATRAQIEEALKGLGFEWRPDARDAMRSGKDYNVWQHPTTKTWYLVGKQGGLRTCANVGGRPPAASKSIGYKPERLFRIWEARKALLAQWGTAPCPDCDAEIQLVQTPEAGGGHKMRFDKHHINNLLPLTVCPGTGKVYVDEGTPPIADPPSAFEEDFDGGTVQGPRPCPISGQEGAVNDAPPARRLSPTLQGHVDEFEDSEVPHEGDHGPSND